MHRFALASAFTPAGKGAGIQKAKGVLAAGISLAALAAFNPAVAQAQNVPGVLQHSEDMIAVNLFDVAEGDPALDFGATESASNAGGHALAEAIVACAVTSICADAGAVVQYAHGTTSAANGASIGGDLAIGANAAADGASATAAGIVQTGLWQVAAAGEVAENELQVGGSLDIGASGDALAATGSAVAFAGIGAGISQIASAIGSSGSAANLIGNSGTLNISAIAEAEALAQDAAATAFVGVGIYQEANGQAAAGAELANSGAIAIAAHAAAEAPNGMAAATASAAGIVQLVDARTRQFASAFTDGGNLVGTTTDTPSGPATVTLTNSGSIQVDVQAAAHGGIDVSATGAVLGISQLVSGSKANAAIDNSGSIEIAATVESEGGGTPRGVVFVSGISQAATAYAFSTVETIDPSGVLTYQLSASLIGPAVASFVNSGDIMVAGEVDVIALGTTSMAEGLGVAFVDGFDQYANGDGASANLDNSGSFTVSADVTVDSGNLSNAVAVATGIDQNVTAYASHATIIFANGTTSPTTFTGGATAIGNAAATLDNSGAITVLASIDSHGDEVAFGGATASAIGQFAAGVEATVNVANSGTIVAAANLESSGHNAFGGAGAIGMQQGAQGTALAEAGFDNGGTLAVLASAAASGEVGAFVNATAFGVAQNVQAERVASAQIANAGTIDIRAIGSAVAGDTGTLDMAMAFADAHGIGQLAQGAEAQIEFENSGTFQLLAEVDAAADDFALASAIASGAVQQIASGTASGTGLASIDNSGTILIGAFADVAAGSTAAALAGVQSAVVQAVIAGEGGSASLTNSGAITMIADAEALAAGGEITDVGSAQAYALGIYAGVSATGTAGFADVALSNDGTIDINALAHATGSGLAQAIATVASGLVGVANVAGTGPADVALTNNGELTLVGMAEATGGYTAHATGIAVRGMDATAFGGEASVGIVNSGELTLAADAHASAGTNALAVAIAIDGFNAVAQANAGDGLVDITNSGELSMLANATASALNAQAFAIVGGTLFSGGVFQSVGALNGDAGAMVDNSGSISIVADALANGGVIASASAVGGPGVNQFAFATSGDAFSGIGNSGSLEFVAHGEANATNSAYADAVFFNAVGQFASAFNGKGAANLTNEGSISVAILAEARGDAAAGALAIASHAIGQVAMAINGDATAELDNSGAIEINVGAIAEGSLASATAALATGLVQVASAMGGGDAALTLDNSGSIDMSAVASAESPDGAAGAFAELGVAISQVAGAVSSQFASGTAGGQTTYTQTIAPTGASSLLLDNSGSLDIAAAAIAEGGTSALAEASGNGIIQAARGLDASASLLNDGSVEISIGAMAEGELLATASGSLTAVVQHAAAMETTIHATVTAGGSQLVDSFGNPVGTALVSFANSGTFEVVGVAEAEASGGAALATLFVQGIDQSVAGLDATAEFANGGELSVVARAEAVAGTAATASATALGYAVYGSHVFGLDFTNDGELLVLAEAVADGATGQAVAYAVGLEASGEGALSGSIDNDGELLVRAEAEAGGGGIAGATGVRIGTNADGLALTNSGVLAVEAVTDGGTGAATGIAVFDNGSAGPGNVTITNDGGTIIARVSNDGGTSWSRGTAIDLSAASGSSVLNLVGDGGIRGNIDLAAGQTVNVTGSETWLDGIINPECLSGGCGQGMLNIASGGALFLRHGADGPSAAHVEQLNIAANGSLIFELPAGADPEATYPQITAGTANLDGALLVRPASGLFADSYLFDNVIDADARNGQFDSCGIDGNPALLDMSCVYDAQGNVDLGIERIAFNEVAGLTRNQAAAGSGIETVYDVGLTGPFADMVEQLFTFDEAEYVEALDQLTGAGYAAYLQSFSSLGIHQNQLLDRATDCEVPGQLASSLSCRTGKIRLWGQLDYASRRHDGDQEAPAYDADRWTAIVGGDVEVAPHAIVGASLAKLGNRLDFLGGGKANADGYEVGGYAAFDPGTYYAKVVGTFGWFDGDSSRSIDWTPIGGALAGQLRGDPDVRLWTLGAHFGYRVALGEAAILTPFLDLDHSSAKLDGFTETGLAGPALAVKTSKSSQTVVTVGAKWAADVGNVVPQAELGYRYRLGDRRAAVDTAFAAEAGSDFEIVSASEKRGSLLAGISLGGKAGPVDVRIGYEGLFDGTATSHSGNLRLVLPLGK